MTAIAPFLKRYEEDMTLLSATREELARFQAQAEEDRMALAIENDELRLANLAMAEEIRRLNEIQTVQSATSAVQQMQGESATNRLGAQLFPPALVGVTPGTQGAAMHESILSLRDEMDAVRAAVLKCQALIERQEQRAQDAHLAAAQQHQPASRTAAASAGPDAQRGDITALVREIAGIKLQLRGLQATSAHREGPPSSSSELGPGAGGDVKRYGPNAVGRRRSSDSDGGDASADRNAPHAAGGGARPVAGGSHHADPGTKL
ncbi:hypothetical protein HK405_006030 [Cladochytrium tenue]|nr:hypothetical protein HK405_006030 [Cladochytrium tenue]